MLFKKSEVILDVLIEQDTASTTVSYLGINEFLIPRLPDSDKYNWSFDSVSTLLQQLIDEEYVNAELFYNGEYPIPDYRYITLTYKGLNYNEYKRKKRWNYFLKSILVPIIVSLITSALGSIGGYIWGNNILQSHQKNLVNTTVEITDTTNGTTK